MSKEQAKGFFEAISKDEKLNEEVKDVMGGQATKQEKAKELLSLAKRNNFNFTEDELKTSLSREDLADIAGGSGVGQAVVSSIMATTLGLGGTPAPLQLPIEQPAAIVQQQAGNAQNEGDENEAPAANVDEEVEEIHELTEEEIAARQQREEQERREREERLAQGPLELDEPNWFGNEDTNRVFRWINGDDTELTNRVNRLNTLYYRLLYAPQGQELMERIRNYIATVGFTFDRGTASLQEQISIADALIHEAEEMLQRAEQQRGEELRGEELREEIQHGLDALALILQRTHTGLPGGTDLYTDVQYYLANRESFSREVRMALASELLHDAEYFRNSFEWYSPLRIAVSNEAVNKFEGFAEYNLSVLEERLESKALPWLARVSESLGVPGERGLALEIQKFFDTLGDEFTDEHLAEMNSLLDRARELMMNRARAYTRFDMDQEHIEQNDLQLAQMLGIDGEYVEEKIKNKIKMSPNDITGTIELPNGDTVTFNFMIGSGTLVLTGTGNTVIGGKFDNGSLLQQLTEPGIVFKVMDDNVILTRALVLTREQVPTIDANVILTRAPVLTREQVPTPDYPFVVRNLIIGNGITEIGEDAFGLMSALRSVYFLGAVRSIGADAFFGGDRSSLREVGFAQPEAVERIEELAFREHRSLVSINIPQNANIDKSAFHACENLKKQGCPYCKE